MSILSIFNKLRGAVSYQETPKAPVERAWDAAGAKARLWDWAGGDDNTDWAKYRKGFTWYDAEKAETKGAYKLPHHDVTDGGLVVVWRGVATAMTALLGGRGGVDIPEADVNAVYNHLAKHYKQFDKEPPERVVRADIEETAEAPAKPRGIIEATQEDMAIINAVHSREPLGPDQVYIIEPVVSTNALDSYFTRQAESSLRNYAEDAQAGSPLLASHNILRLPIGRSFAGSLEEVDGLASVVVRDYMLRGHDIDGIKTDELAKGIQAGTLSDMSIRFGGPDQWYRCGICGLDLWDEECPHVPGLMYGDMRAFAWVEDARMIEHSIVFSGAAPGAVIRKARSMIAAGKVSKSDVGYLEDALRVRLHDSRVIYSPTAGIEQEDEDMKARELIEKLRGFFDKDRHPATHAKLEALRQDTPEEATADTVLGTLAQLWQEGMEHLAAGAEALKQRAELGDKYRAELIEETLAEGIRAYADGFNSDIWKRVLESPERTIDEIKAFQAQFAEEATKRLGEGGRQTTPPDPNKAPAPKGQGFDDLSREEQEVQIKDFLARTGGG